MHHLAICCSTLCVLLTGCAGPPSGERGPTDADPTGLTDSGVEADSGGEDPDVVWADVLPTFQDQCGQCHMVMVGGEATGSIGFGFDEPTDLLIPSLEAPHLPYVTPGAPQDSYLWHKVAGTHVEADGEGDRMPPPPTPPLETAELDLIHAWIVGGAR